MLFGEVPPKINIVEVNCIMLYMWYWWKCKNMIVSEDYARGT